MLDFILEVICAILYANLAEWVLHKYLLHAHASAFKNTKYFIAHFREHHRNCRRYQFYDPRYEKPIWAWNERGREAAGVLALVLAHFPLYYYIPIFYVIITVYALAYVILHRYMHIHTSWGQKYFPHHFDHHCRGDQQFAWGVLLPLWDHILGTRYFDVKDRTYKRK